MTIVGLFLAACAPAPSLPDDGLALCGYIETAQGESDSLCDDDDPNCLNIGCYDQEGVIRPDTTWHPTQCGDPIRSVHALVDVLADVQHACERKDVWVESTMTDCDAPLDDYDVAVVCLTPPVALTID